MSRNLRLVGVHVQKSTDIRPLDLAHANDDSRWTWPYRVATILVSAAVCWVLIAGVMML